MVTKKLFFRWRWVWIPVVMFFVFASGLQECAAYLAYRYNQGAIESSLCINKSKPVLKCNGKCYLKKKIREQKENSTPVSFVYNSDAPFTLFLPVRAMNVYFLWEQYSRSLYCYQDVCCSGAVSKLFRPPRSLA